METITIKEELFDKVQDFWINYNHSHNEEYTGNDYEEDQELLELSTFMK